MIHPSYFELMNIVNKDVEPGEEPVITSRYSIVLGTAKRARQLVAANRTTYRGTEEKPLSIAVDELKNGEIHILKSLPEDEAEEAGEDLFTEDPAVVPETDWEDEQVEEDPAEEEAAAEEPDEA